MMDHHSHCILLHPGIVHWELFSNTEIEVPYTQLYWWNCRSLVHLFHTRNSLEFTWNGILEPAPGHRRQNGQVRGPHTYTPPIGASGSASWENSQRLKSPLPDPHPANGLLKPTINVNIYSKTFCFGANQFRKGRLALARFRRRPFARIHTSHQPVSSTEALLSYKGQKFLASSGTYSLLCLFMGAGEEDSLMP